MNDIDNLIIGVAKTKGWKLTPTGLVKQIADDSELYGFLLSDLREMVLERMPETTEDAMDIIETTLDNIEGNFVLMSMGYEVYDLKEDEDGQAGQAG